VSKMRGVRFMVVAGLVAGTVGLAACGDDEEEAASEAASSIQSQVDEAQGSVEDRVDSALSEATDGDVQSQVESALSEADGDVQSQVESALSEATDGDIQSQVESALSEAETAAADATGGEDTGGDATGQDTSGAGDPAAGKEVFNSAGCAGCHTLADAAAAGAVGPNLDEAQPSYDTIVTVVTNGAPPMPAFKGQLSDADIQNVAAYVSSVAGQ